MKGLNYLQAFKSKKNLYLYTKNGYVEFKREKVNDNMILIFLGNTNRLEKEKRTTNKPFAIMAVDVITQASVLRKSISDYPSALTLIPPRLQSAKR